MTRLDSSIKKLPQTISSGDLIEWIQSWLQEENTPVTLGVLATVDKDNFPHTRTIAIREIDQRGILFFTQKGSKKVNQLHHCNQVSLTLVLPQKNRQISFRGSAEPLSEQENQSYWDSYPEASQNRFRVYGPRSGEQISDNDQLDQELKTPPKASLEKPDAYIGYRISPQVIDFYQLNTERMSDSLIATQEGNRWILSRVIP